MPFGEVRTISGVTNISETDFGYTNQRNSYIKLLDYKARSYSPYLNRFIQPDSIVPNPLNPQSLNRFSYTLNNPINYNDPTGHCSQGNAEECGRALNAYASWYFENELNKYGVDLATVDDAEWEIGEKSVALDAVRAIDKEFQEYGSDFKSGMGTGDKPITLWKSDAGCAECWAQTSDDGSDITFFFGGGIEFSLGLIIHEFGHSFDFRHGEQPTLDWGAEGGWNWTRYGTVDGSEGFRERDYNISGSGYLYYYFGDLSVGDGEEFADMFVALVLDYSPTEALGAFPLQIASGNFRRGFMETSMPVWLSGGSSTPPGNIDELYPWP